MPVEAQQHQASQHIKHCHKRHQRGAYPCDALHAEYDDQQHQQRQDGADGDLGEAVAFVEQFAEMDISREARAVADSVFMDDDQQQYEESGEEEMALTDLPIDKALIDKLNFYDIYSVEEFINLTDEDFAAMPNLSADEIEKINEIIKENVDIIEDEAEVEDGEETFACPKCGYPLKVGMTECPNCHVGISFEEVEEEENEE